MFKKGLNIVYIFILLFIASCGPSKETLDLIKQSKLLFQTIPSSMPGSETDTKIQIQLGQILYFDKKFSSNKDQSCNTCHLLETGNDHGVDHKATSSGSLGQMGDRNSPTTWNAGFHLAQFWDGRSPNLDDQAIRPIFNPLEMNLKSEQDLINIIKNNSTYLDLFPKAFPQDKNPFQLKNFGKAIAAFERRLITNDRFNEFVKGNHKALSKAEQRGLKIFINVGCTTCHSGPMLGARMYQKVGLINPYENAEDLGRFNVTKNEVDKFVFKVPSLRNVANTYPYFHDGKVKTLEESVKKMAKMQLNVILSEKQLQYIVVFLNSLNKTNTIDDVIEDINNL